MLIGSSRRVMSFGEFPSFSEFYIHIMLIVYSDDLVFFLTHRMLHIPCLYRHVHKHGKEVLTQFSFAIAVFMLGSRLHVSTYLFFVMFKVYLSNETSITQRILDTMVAIRTFGTISRIISASTLTTTFLTLQTLQIFHTLHKSI